MKLISQERKEIGLLVDAVLVNPFSQERMDINQRLHKKMGDLSWEESRGSVYGIVKGWVEKLEKKEAASFTEYIGDDSRLVRFLTLFYVYHCYTENFDLLIQDQISAGDRAVSVSFYKDVMADLKRFGFCEEAQLFYFALFFQIRRAFYFIYHDLKGVSPSMTQLRYELWNAVFTHDLEGYVDGLWQNMQDFSTLILGPTGSGKGVAAAAIGRSGFIPFDIKKGCFVESFSSVFISINLSEIPDSLMESILFGHKEGTFTGAIQDKVGVLQRSSRFGATFLDEVGEISTMNQVKLLKVLEERRYRAVGSEEDSFFHGRIIAATHQDLKQKISKGQFREDFYFRLCSDIVTMPSLSQRLSERPSELALLVHHVLPKLSVSEGYEQRVLDVLRDSVPEGYHWPGNVRELVQFIRRIILKGYLKQDVFEHESDNEVDLSLLRLTATELLSAYCQSLYKQFESYQDIADITDLDWRTVKKYITKGTSSP